MYNIDYEEKYLKYKNKYIELKKTMDNKSQVGGKYYAKGTFVFFLTENQVNPTSDTGKVLLTNKMNDINKFTNQLGSCALFLRIGSTTTGFDVNHTYDSIYPNKSAISVLSKTVVDTTNKAIDASKTAYNASIDVGNKALEASKTVYNATSNTGKAVYDTYNKSQVNLSTQQNQQLNKQIGGDTCDYVPIKLNDFGMKSIKYISDVNPKSITDIVSNINKKALPEHNIVCVIVVQKSGNMTNDAEILNRYDITYNNNNISDIKLYQY